MGIVNAGMIEIYDEIDPKLRDLLENAIFNKTSSATEDLVEHARGTECECQLTIDMAWCPPFGDGDQGLAQPLCFGDEGALHEIVSRGVGSRSPEDGSRLHRDCCPHRSPYSP